MTTRDTPFAPGTPSWVDLSSSDVAKSKAFYEGVFGWTYLEGGEEFGGYVTCLKDGLGVGGMMSKMNPDMPDVWSTYIATTDAEATFAAATAAGATPLVPPMDVKPFGRMAFFSDPAGAVVGLWQAEQMTGFGRYNEVGAVTWDELHSKDFHAATDFYQKVFGWTYEVSGDTDEFRYYQGEVDGKTVAGLMDAKAYLPDSVPSHWTVYFSVADTDESQAKAVELGGSVLRSAEDTPFGRMADMLDPTGANFKLHSMKMANPA